MKCYCNHVRNVDFAGSYQTPVCLKIEVRGVRFLVQSMFSWSIPHSQMISFRALPPKGPIVPLENFVLRLMLKNNTDKKFDLEFDCPTSLPEYHGPESAEGINEIPEPTVLVETAGIMRM